LHNGAIILLHDRCKGADELLQMLIEEIKAQNYGIINIDEMLDIDPYKMDI
jgi:peptidoglycan/xylan/chitin deacetylase (PgdA/CDA1 family)